MQYREYGRTARNNAVRRSRPLLFARLRLSAIKVSALGFGCMRLLLVLIAIPY